ncbi:MAG: hypothetical protein L6Q57_09195 [Alphaproteobacteria bacterium]|nr:hypothetical protein [Alphaproteobacteria bacterium]
MSDDSKKDFEDIPDAEFDDLDDDAALEAWDDLEDSEMNNGNMSKEDAMAAAVDFLEADDQPAQRSFLQKYFNLIVIVVAVLGGGAFFVANFGSSPDKGERNTALNPPSEETLAAPGVSETPPATPEAIADQAASLPEALPTPEASQQPAPGPSSDLTPMPDFAALPEAAPADQQEMTVTSGPEATSIETAPSAELPPIVETPLVVEAPAVLPLPETPSEQPPADVAVLDLPPAAPPAPEAPVVEPPVVEAPPAAEMPAEAPAIEVAPAETPQTTDSASTEAVKSVREQELEDNVVALTAKLEQLTGRLADMEAQLQAAQTAAASTAPAAEKPAPVAKKSTKKRSSKKASSGAPPKVVSSTRTSSSWQLRSAQPGKALVAEARTGDLRSVEVGDSLPGIGKITAITQDGGVWRIQGTRGALSAP